MGELVSGVRVANLKAFSLVWALPFISFLSLARGEIPEELHTGGGIPLVSATQSLFAPNLVPETRLQLNFGFSTDEIFAPDQFFDSFTITLQDAGGLSTAVLLVADTSGVTLAPPTPGGIPVNPLSLNLESTAVPPLSLTLAKQLAFHLDAPIPAQMVGGQINVFFDLFDNLDSVPSLGWFSDVSIVPEPGSGSLMLLAVAVLGKHLRTTRWRRK
jgi:hypothetical protein